jgi:hypothetical protein
MNKQDVSVGILVDMYKRQELQLPELQRRYVWRASRVRDLLDSLYRGYPSGSILVWETDEEVPTRASAIAQDRSPFRSQKLLLDGQQRLTSLTAVLSGEPVKVRGRKNPIDILFNLEHPEDLSEVTEVEGDAEPLVSDEDDIDDDEEEDEDDLQARLQQRTFVVASKVLARQPNWVSVTKVFSGATDRELLQRAGVQDFDDPRFEKYTERLARLRAINNYMYVMQVLGREMGYEEVAEIFVRVNSLGMKLRGSDLALAQISAKWRGCLDLLEEYQEACERESFTLDAGLLARTMVVFATGQPKFARVGTTPIEDLKKGWDEAKLELDYAINFLRKNAGIEDETLLSSPMLMIPVAVFSHQRKQRLTRDDEQALLYWLHVANARGRYSRGSAETLLAEDLNILFRGGTPQDLLEPIRRLFGRLDVSPADLAGRPSRSPLFPLTYLALKARGAKDWETGLGITLVTRGRQHVVQYHHIFPKALLREAEYEPREINEIANLAFVGGRTNQRIGRKPPAEYFPEIISRRGREALESQLIPQDPSLHRVESYREFLEARRALLAEAINEHIAAAQMA